MREMTFELCNDGAVRFETFSHEKENIELITYICENVQITDVRIVNESIVEIPKITLLQLWSVLRMLTKYFNIEVVSNGGQWI